MQTSAGIPLGMSQPQGSSTCGTLNLHDDVSHACLQVMYIFVAVAAVLLPLGVVCLIYGMQVRSSCWAAMCISYAATTQCRQQLSSSSYSSSKWAGAAGSTSTLGSSGAGAGAQLGRLP
jgi:hypothetical protein